MDKKEFSAVIIPFLEYFDISPTPVKLGIYYNKLKRYSPETLIKTFDKIYSECDDWTKIKLNPIPTINQYVVEFIPVVNQLPETADVPQEQRDECMKFVGDCLKNLADNWRINNGG